MESSCRGNFVEKQEAIKNKIFKHIAAYVLTAAVFTSGVPAVTGTDSLFGAWGTSVGAADYNKKYIERSWNGTKVVDTEKTTMAAYIYSNSSKGGYYDIGDSLIHYYYVEGNVTLKPTLRVSGNTHLILGDGATLYADDGIYIKDGATLHIHAQSEGDSKGKIIAKPSSGPGIGGMNNTVAGSLVIHGGYIDARAAAMRRASAAATTTAASGASPYTAARYTHRVAPAVSEFARVSRTTLTREYTYTAAKSTQPAANTAQA